MQTPWKKLVTRESTLLERFLRFEGYVGMLPPPFSVRQKDLLAVYQHGMTTQYVRDDDYSSKAEQVEKDLEVLGVAEITRRLYAFLEDLAAAKAALLREKSPSSWTAFAASYRSARAVILYASNAATAIKQVDGASSHLDVLQRIYDDTEAQSSAAWRDLEPFFRELAERCGIDLRHLYLLEEREFQRLLIDPHPIDVRMLETRDELTVMKLESYVTIVKYGSDAHALLVDVPDPEEAVCVAHRGLSGACAYQGHVRGTVRVVLRRVDYNHVQSGDVLVVPMTHPDMLEILPRVSAIVTDEGGVLCHAAIVSRELRKPCIIGTKTATQILNDGDLVEVDADAGVVRVLTRA